MTNKEWINLIAKEFNVSNTVAKGMLHSMYEAKKYLSVSRDVHRKEREESERMERQMRIEEESDKDDFFSIEGLRAMNNILSR